MTTQYKNILRQLIINFFGDVDDSNYKIFSKISKKWSTKRKVE